MSKSLTKSTVLRIQQMFGDYAMGDTQIKDGFNRFKKDCTSIERDLNATVVEEEENLTVKDLCLTIQETPEQV
ncbi:hypothetical protein TNCV_4117601 [Trichonephila clavipes]|nr:hypothetical protein TNCV_4117601 [Trichonephila clavipes]